MCGINKCEPNSTSMKRIVWFGKNHSVALVIDILVTTSICGLSNMHCLWLLLKDCNSTEHFDLCSPSNSTGYGPITPEVDKETETPSVKVTYEGEQSRSSQNMPLWHKDYFELIIFWGTVDRRESLKTE